MPRKLQQEPLSITDQIENLKQIGLIIEDESYAAESIEVILRNRVANHFCETYGVLGYKDSKYFNNPKFHAQFITEIEGDIRRNQRSPFIRNFQRNYVNGEIPLYALVELFPFGVLSKFFKNMNNSDKKVVAGSFGVGYTYFESWIESIAYIRNICAHYGLPRRMGCSAKDECGFEQKSRQAMSICS